MSGITPLGFEPPEMCSGASKASLDFVCDAETARGAHVLIGVLEIALGKNDDPTHTLNGFREEAGDLARGG